MNVHAFFHNIIVGEIALVEFLLLCKWHKLPCFSFLFLFVCVCLIRPSLLLTL
jgi:hypothetical protein